MNSYVERRWREWIKIQTKNELLTGSKAWVDNLPIFTNVINTTYCQTLQTSPEDAQFLPEGVRRERTLNNGSATKKHKGIKSALNVGDLVRLKIRKNLTFKALKQTYSDTVYMVVAVIKQTATKLTTYKISEDGGAPLKGTFNITDLLKTDSTKPIDRSRLIENKVTGNERSIVDQRLVDELDKYTEAVAETRESRRPDADDEGNYEVEKILAKRKFGKKMKYLVKYKGYPVEEATWELTKDINAKELMAEFRKNLRQKKKNHN